MFKAFLDKIIVDLLNIEHRSVDGQSNNPRGDLLNKSVDNRKSKILEQYKQVDDIQ
jgi:hypothetical protein